MIVNRTYLWPLLAGVAVVQSAALFNMVYERDRLLKTGKEIVLPVQPLDPRDIFRGDYVTIGYDFNLLKKSNTETDPDFNGFSPGSTAYVTMTPTPRGAGRRRTSAAHIRPRSPLAMSVIKGSVKHGLGV